MGTNLNNAPVITFPTQRPPIPGLEQGLASSSPTVSTTYPWPQELSQVNSASPGQTDALIQDVFALNTPPLNTNGASGITQADASPFSLPTESQQPNNLMQSEELSTPEKTGIMTRIRALSTTGKVALATVGTGLVAATIWGVTRGRGSKGVVEAAAQDGKEAVEKVVADVAEATERPRTTGLGDGRRRDYVPPRTIVDIQYSTLGDIRITPAIERRIANQLSILHQVIGDNIRPRQIVLAPDLESALNRLRPAGVTGLSDPALSRLLGLDINEILGLNEMTTMMEQGFQKTLASTPCTNSGINTLEQYKAKLSELLTREDASLSEDERAIFSEFMDTAHDPDIQQFGIIPEELVKNLDSIPKLLATKMDEFLKKILDAGALSEDGTLYLFGKHDFSPIIAIGRKLAGKLPESEETVLRVELERNIQLLGGSLETSTENPQPLRTIIERIPAMPLGNLTQRIMDEAVRIRLKEVVYPGTLSAAEQQLKNTLNIFYKKLEQLIPNQT